MFNNMADDINSRILFTMCYSPKLKDIGMKIIARSEKRGISVGDLESKFVKQSATIDDVSFHYIISGLKDFEMTNVAVMPELTRAWKVMALLGHVYISDVHEACCARDDAFDPFSGLTLSEDFLADLKLYINGSMFKTGKRLAYEYRFSFDFTDVDDKYSRYFEAVKMKVKSGLFS
jgi:hypothetical protein